MLSLTEPDIQRPIQWYWAIVNTNNTWVVDYPPLKLGDFIVKRKAAMQESQDRRERILAALQPKLKAIRTRLTPMSEHFVIGSPMLFRIELVNDGDSPIHFIHGNAAHCPLLVLDERRRPLAAHDTPSQIIVNHHELAPATSVVLAEKVDLMKHYQITKPGKYYVQFGGSVNVGEPLPYHPFSGFDFGENIHVGSFDFLAATNRFPSNVIEIRVKARPGK